jgi:hypothetical protein
MAAPYNYYAGEEFLSVSLPHYETERMFLLVKLLLAFVAWIVVFPVLLATRVTPPAEESKVVHVIDETKKKNAVPKKGKKGKSNKSQPIETTEKLSTETTASLEEKPKKEISEIANFLCIIGLIMTFCYIIVTGSPDNKYTTRGVFEAPLFTRDECNFLVDMAETVAQRNYEMAQQSPNNSSENDDAMLLDPIGWQKKRHKVHSTTDLNVITDPFSREDRQWIKKKLDARLAPTIERLYGVPQGAIRANDVFVIRYDGDRQAALLPHTDDGDVTFSALLSDGFTGGGTNYYDRRNHYYHNGKIPYQTKPDEVFAHVLPEIGQMTLFRGPILHEGVQIKEGRRYLLIGFLSVDNVDPWTETKRSTGLSWFASWLSLNWAAVRFGIGYQSALVAHANNQEKEEWMKEDNDDWINESPYIRGLFIQAHLFLTKVADLTSTHFLQQIVPDSQTKPFVDAMDAAHGKNPPKKLASWFSGQQVDLNIGGSVQLEWSTRTRNADKFEQEAI